MPKPPEMPKKKPPAIKRPRLILSGNCVACQGTGVSSAGGRCTPCKGTGKPIKPTGKGRWD